MKHAPYPRYKPSEVKWLGEVPEHWKVIQLKRIASLYAGGTPDRSDYTYWDEGSIPWINSGAVNQGLITEPSAYITAEGYENSSAKWVSAGALVMALAGQGKTKGMVAQIAIAATCNQSIAAICPREQEISRYLFWLLTAQYESIRGMAGSEQRDGLNLEIVGSIPCLLAPKAEICAIVDFLDRETTKLDTLIAKKRELIEKLKEKRTALISRTVTRGLPPDAARAVGLNPHPRLKASGIEWLGEVPEHWEVKQLRWAAMFQRGHDLPADEREEGDVPLVSSSGISASHSIAIAKGPGIVTGRYGTIGQFYLIDKDYWPLNTTLYSVNLYRNCPEFLTYMLTHLAPLFLLNAVKSAVPGVDRNDIHPIKAAIPPLAEQHAIAAYLDKKTAEIDILIFTTDAAIIKLQEYRTALITAAVTGKIDVRGMSTCPS